jgi:hypothetical protein
MRHDDQWSRPRSRKPGRSLPGFARGDAFDDSELRTLQLLDLKALRLEVIERLTQEVVRREPHREGVEEALDGPYDRSLAPHVLEKQ